MQTSMLQESLKTLLSVLTGQTTCGVLFANFQVNSYELPSDHDSGLRTIAEIMKQHEFGFVARLEGRASQTGSEDNNEMLAINRAKAVRDRLLDYEVPQSQIGEIFGYGSKYPLDDKPGEELAVNRSVLVYYELPLQTVIPPKPRPTSRPDGSSEWAVCLQMTTGGGSFGFAVGKLKNVKSGKKYVGTFQGMGIGVGAMMPGAVPDDNWVYFKTDGLYNIEDFHGTVCRLTTAGFGFFIGYCETYISFPMMGKDAISLDVGGVNFGSIGADASTTVGWWNVHGM